LTIEQLFNTTLNMRSTPQAILDAALVCFAHDGFATPLRAIADEAGVSAALIVHHYGSKAGLREAVDDHVLGLTQAKMHAFEAGGVGAAIATVTALMEDGAVPRYLSRVLLEGGDGADRLFTAFVDVTEKALVDIDVTEPRVTAALLVTHSFGLMAMADQVERATGVNPYRGEGVQRLIAAAVNVYGGALTRFLAP
jgi:AcrR family transcriptional regulator